MTRQCMMAATLIVSCFGVFVPTVEAVDRQADRRAGAKSDDSGVPRRFHEINNDMRDLGRRYARSTTEVEKAALIRQMCDLYLELKRDPRLSTSDTLKSYKAKLWSRLTRIQNDIEQHLSRQARRQGASPPKEQFTSPGEQQAQGASNSLAGALSLLGGVLGGPGDVFANGGSFGGGAQPADLGPALVELIQRTIAPEFWDVNGGPGTIVYFAPLRVLVVRATSEVHHNIGGAVGGLRRAGN